MPTYEYRCTQCEHVFDCGQRMGDPVPACPKCGSPTRKVFSSVGLIFKGKGFYSTDHRKPAPADGEAAPATKDTAAKDTTTAKAKETTTEEGSSASKDTPTSAKDSSAPKGGASSSASDS